MNYSKIKGVTLVALLCSAMLTAQTNYPKKDWMLLDAKNDSVAGMSVRKGYTLLTKKKPTKVIVAVIDSGVDYLHEDLKSVMWVNAGEVAGNGKDDDGNGYVDDIHGWNFIGGKDGSNVEHDNLELTRLYRDLSKQFEGKNGPFTDAEENKQFELYKKVKLEYEGNVNEVKGMLKIYLPIYYETKAVKEGIKDRFSLDNATLTELSALKLEKSDTLEAKVEK